MLFFGDTIDYSAEGYDKERLIQAVVDGLVAKGYTIAELAPDKPWGFYVRITSSQADTFIKDFFPGLSPDDARLGVEGVELSPKILVVAPRQRLSWQYHHRRSERWFFLTEGGYNKSVDDEPGELYSAQPGDSVQFETGERHRLHGRPDGAVIVAEIWQHSDKDHLSDEGDIVRLLDDYKR